MGSRGTAFFAVSSQIAGQYYDDTVRFVMAVVVPRGD
jgi:hypothetical protein